MEDKNLVRKRMEIRDVRDPFFCVWLEEMAEKGLLFKSSGVVFAQFTESTPQKRRYRAIEKPYNSMDAEEKGIYESTGWTPVYTAGSVTFFTTDDPDAPELFSDTESYVRSVRRKRTGLIVLLIAVAISLIIIINNMLHPDSYYADICGRMHAWDLQGGITDIMFVICDILLVVIWIFLFANHISIIKLYNGNRQNDYDVPYNDAAYLKSKRRNTCITALMILMLILLAAILVYSIADTGLPEGAEALNYSGDKPVMLREIDPEAWDRVLPAIQSGPDNDGITETQYMIGKDSPGFVFSQYYTERTSQDIIPDGETDELQTIIYCYSEYMTARREEYAMEYLGEEIAYDLNGEVDGDDAWSKYLDQVKFDCEGVDYAGYYEADEWNSTDGFKTQHLYLRKGKSIQIVTYVGAENLKDKKDLFIAEFE